MATISISREELLAKLAQAKVKADREDAKAAARHEKEEQAALKRFRDQLREALKWDYKTTKQNYFRVGSRNDFPSCPMRHATRIEIAIEQIKLDTRKGRFHLNENSDWYKAAMWLPESERPKASVCD
jgi:hypothetical protein